MSRGNYQIHRESLDSREGYSFAYQGLTSIIGTASDFISLRVRSIQETNRPVIEFLKAKGDIIFAEWQDLIHQLTEASQHQPQQGTFLGVWNFTVFIFLFFASWAFNRLTLEGFSLPGMYVNLYSIGAALALPWIVDRFITRFRARRLIDTLTAVTFISSLSTGLLFAIIRGIAMARQLDAMPAVVIDDLGIAPGAAEESAKHVVFLLQCAWFTAAATFELVGGQALNEFRVAREKEDPGRLLRIQKATLTKEREYRAVLQERYQMMAEAALLEGQYWADFERGLIDAKKRRQR